MAQTFEASQEDTDGGQRVLGRSCGGRFTCVSLYVLNLSANSSPNVGGRLRGGLLLSFVCCCCCCCCRLMPYGIPPKPPLVLFCSTAGLSKCNNMVNNQHMLISMNADRPKCKRESQKFFFFLMQTTRNSGSVLVYSRS